MALRRPRHPSLAALLGRELTLDEDPGTLALIAGLRHVKQAGEFSRAEFLRMCRWKSPRAAPHYAKNRASRIRAISRAALATRCERRRMEALTTLSGVNVPVASAILTLIDPARYGVLDIRVWQLLFALRCVDGKPGGRGFTVRDWQLYLDRLRPHARRLGVSARAVEYTLFRYHQKLHTGRLYA